MNGQLKLLPPVKPQLGLYLRPGRNDHTVFQQLLAEDRAVSGLVLDGRLGGRQQILREALVDNGVHAVLDPDFMQLSTPGGIALAGLANLPWADLAQATSHDLRGGTGRRLAIRLVDAVEAGAFSAVLAPTHLLADAFDEMFAADRAVAGYLRAELDHRGLTHVSIQYPLALPAISFRELTQRTTIVQGLRSTPADGLWLRLHPFGTGSAGPIALRRYLDVCWELQRIGLPLTAEHTGTIGIALMAFGAVGGIESGITLGERFDASSLLKARSDSSKPFSPAARVYLHEMASFVSRKSAATLFENRAMIAALGCRDPQCCRRGVVDTMKDPRRHFVLRRTAEVDLIGKVPPEHRAKAYVQDVLRPAVLQSVRAARVLSELLHSQRRLESWHLTLDAILSAGNLPEATPALGQRVNQARPRPQALR